VEANRVGTNSRAPALVVEAPVVRDVRPAARAAVGAEVGANSSATDGAACEPREQVGGFVPVPGSTHKPPTRCTRVDGPAPLEPVLYSVPQVIRDDPQVWGRTATFTS